MKKRKPEWACVMPINPRQRNVIAEQVIEDLHQLKTKQQLKKNQPKQESDR